MPVSLTIKLSRYERYFARHENDCTYPAECECILLRQEYEKINKRDYSKLFKKERNGSANTLSSLR